MSTATSHRSLAKKFNTSLIIMYLSSIVVAAPVVYLLTKQQVYERANEELVLLVDVVKSIQEYVATDLRPHFMAQGIFYTPAISGIVASARITKYLNKRQPKYYITNVSDNPLNPSNKATGLGRELLKRFRADRSIKGINEEGYINDQSYLVSSAPKISKKGCMRCHGDPGNAPKDQIASFGKRAGYGYKPNEVVGVSVVGVPLEDVRALSIERSMIVIGAITALFALLFTIVNMLVKRLILRPIAEITAVATAVSQGDLNQVVGIEGRNDEIADLAHAFELMRRSLTTAMKRMKRKS